jgi:hypothetical protein
VNRVVEYGVGLRLLALMNWQISLAEEITIGELLAEERGHLQPESL